MSDMTPERLAEIRARHNDRSVKIHFIDRKDTDDLFTHIEAQAKRIAELQADKARLDWLEKNDYFEVTLTHGNEWLIADSFTMDEVYAWSGKGKDLRQAIDNAKENNDT